MNATAILLKTGGYRCRQTTLNNSPKTIS